MNPPPAGGVRLRLDTSVRRFGGGLLLVGGSPLRMLRLTPAGAALVDGLAEGDEGVSTTGAAAALVARMVRAGIAHPLPPAGAGPDPAQVSVVIPVVEGDVVAPADVGEVVVERDPRRTGPAATRNRGWRRASGEYVAFLDADSSARQGWLDVVLAHFSDGDVAAVAPRVVASAGASLIDRYESFRSPLDLGPEPAPVVAGSRVSYVPTAALVVRRSALEDVGGFDESLRYGEDVDFVWRLTDAGGVVRYEPRAVVEHRSRSTVAELMRQRFHYGTSAAPLARRHPGALAPLRISGWSALAWALIAAGRPRSGVAVGAATTVALARKVRDWQVAVHLAGRGHVFAGRQIADALIRTWWPLAVVASVVSRRARRAVLAAAVLPHLIEWAQRRPSIDPLRWLALRVLDDVSYGAGVWAGCLRHRQAGPLLPDLPLRDRQPQLSPSRSR